MFFHYILTYKYRYIYMFYDNKKLYNLLSKLQGLQCILL